MNNVSKNTIAIAFFVAVFLAPAVFPPFIYADSISANTYSVSSIGHTSAVLNGFVANTAGDISTVFFEWGENYLLSNRTSSQPAVGSKSFYAIVSGLLPGKTYYYRAVAISESVQGIAYGVTLDFGTSQRQYLSQQTPTVETRSASNVTSASAVLVGAVNPQGSSDTMRWFEWGTTQSLGSQTPKANQGTSAGDFSYSISDLKQNTTYYYKAVAQNANGVVTGSLFSFQTGGPNYLPTTPTTGVTPIAITQIPSGISRTEATLNGLALPGGTVATRGWFEWGTTMDLGNITVVQDIGNAASIPFSQKISGLSPGSSYYFRAAIQNERGKSQGTILRLVTDSSVVSPPATTGGPKTPPKVIATTTATNTASVGIFQKCLPNSLAGWLLIILIIILIVIAIDHLVDRYQKRKEEKKRQEWNINKEGENKEGGTRVIK